MDTIEKAALLFGKGQQTNQGATHSANVTTITGVATSDSEDGAVMVDVGGATISQDDVQAVELPTTCDVREGDTVQIKVAGADGSAKSLMVDGVVGGGDRTDGKIEKIKAIVRETDEGIEISKPESEFTTVTTNDSYLIKRNGKITTKISESEQIYYHEVDGESKPYGKILCEQNDQFRRFQIIGIGTKFAPAINMGCSDHKSMISIMADVNNPKAGSFGVYMSQFPNENNGNPVSFLIYNNNNIINYLHPIGSYYFSDNATSPAQLFGGTWEKLAEGTFLMSAGELYPVGSTGGEATHTLTVDEMPAHRHAIDEWITNTYNGSKSAWSAGMTMQSGNNKVRAIHDSDTDRYAANTGDGQPHNNLPPYRTTNIWRRVA